MSNSNIRFNCPNCQKSLKANASIATGKKVVCPKCQHTFKFERPEESTKPNVEYVVPATEAGSSKAVAILAGLVAVVLVVGGVFFAAANWPTPKDKDGQTKIAQLASPTELKAGTNPSQTTTTTHGSTSPEVSQPTIPTGPTTTQTFGNDGAKGIEHNEGVDRGHSVAPRPNDNPELPVFDPDRPQNNPNGGGINGAPANPTVPVAPNQPIPVGGQPIVPGAPVIVRVPVPFPVPVPTNPAANGPVDVNVDLEPVDKSSDVMVVDHQSKPGISAKLTVHLDETPSSDVKVTIVPQQGLAVDKQTITFDRGKVPQKQTITISGNGKANLGSSYSNVLYLTVTAEGKGLAANGPVKIPVQVIRRFNWGSTDGKKEFIRQDLTKGAKENWTMPPFQSTQETGRGVYTKDYIEITGAVTGQKYRIYDDRLEMEVRANSGNFVVTDSGFWN